MLYRNKLLIPYFANRNTIGYEMTDSQPKDLLFEEITPLRFYVHVTKSLWELIVTAKHPVMAGKQTEVQAAIKEPDTIRQSRKDSSVYLFYKLEHFNRWICAVVKRVNGNGFLITTYSTDAIKEGNLLWHK